MKKFNIISMLIVAIFFLGSTQSVQGIEKEKKIHKNVYIEDIDVSSLTKKEAIIKINNILDKNNKLDLDYKEGKCEINLSDLGVSYNVDQAVNDAFNIDKKESVIKDLKTKISLSVGNKKVIKLKYTYDNEKLKDCIESIADKNYISPVDAIAKVENGIIQKSKEKYGKMIDSHSLNQMIVNRIKGIYAYEIEVPILSIEPKFKLSELNKIDTILGKYETYFNPEIENRVNNIRIASNATSNILIDRHEEFSFNSILMKSNSLKNMKEAPVIINGKLDKGLGGGICQVSSTIYNAALYAGMDITNIRNHSIPSTYISKGRDATVSLGDVDFKFKNKFNTPILIYNEVKENKIVSTVYGNSQDKKDIEIITEIVQVLPNKVIQKNSDKFYKGEKVIEEEGRRGYKVNTFRIYKEDSTKEFVYESYYPPMNKIILHGTKIKEMKSENIKTKYI